MHALFDKHSATNRWSIKSSFLKDLIEYFSPKTDKLDVYHEDGKVTFMSYTEGISTEKNGVYSTMGSVLHV
jgi:cell cycle checkpoint control protein RAD9A